jgi:hypothetical protein
MRKKLALLALTVFLALQLVPAPAAGNPPSDPNRAFHTVMQPPPEVLSILRRACYDCHSNETKWPWYAFVAPVSWPVRDHVVKGRKHLNFSEWLKPGEKQFTTWSDLEEIAQTVADKSMPLEGYDLMHPEAKLTPAERKLISQWADSAIGVPRP